MAQAPSPPRRVGEALSGATSLPRNLCARVVARVVAIARSPQSDPSPVLPRACPRVPTPATATRARRPADADPSPSPPHAGLTIEDTSGETSARLRARFAAAHGLDGVRFRPFGEALLDAEDRARDASRAAPPLARRDDAGWPDDAPAGDAAAGLLLGRLKSNKYSIPDDLGASDDDDDDANDDDDADLDLLDALPPGADPIDASPPRVTLRRARSMQTRDARRARRSRCVLFPGARLDAVDHDEELYADGARVVWSSGGVVRARFTAPEPVRQALWCRFPERNSAEDWDVDRSGFDGVGLVSDDASDEPVLCLRHAAAMTTYAPGGASLAVPLPRDVLGDARATALGLLLPTRRGVVAVRHPLDEPSPIVPADADSDPDGVEIAGSKSRATPTPTRTPTPTPSRSSRSTRRRSSAFAIPAPNDRIVWSSADSLFVLTHDASLRAHALWRLAPAADSDASAAFAPFDDVTNLVGGATPGAPPDTPGMDTPGGTSKSSPEPENAHSSRAFAAMLSSAERSRVSFARVWIEPVGAAPEPATFAAVTHDDDGAPTLATLRDGALTGYALERRDAFDGDGDVDRPDGRGRGPPRVSFAIEDVAAAVAVAATRAPLLDLVVARRGLRAAGAGLELFCGARRAHAWDADAFLLADEDEPSPRVGSVVRLHSPVGPRFTAETAEGVAARLAAPTAPQDPAAAALTRAVDATFEGDERAEVMAIVSAASARAVARAPTVAPFGALGPDAAAEWNAVAGALLGWCGCEALADRFASSRDEDESRSKRVDARDDDESGDEDDWSYLLATSSRETRLATSRYPALRSSPSETSTSPSSDEPTPRSRGVPSLDDANLARAFALLDATHATYEASKLDALRRPTLSRLGRLCVALATACRGTGTDSGRRANVAATAAGYLDRHARDGGGVFAADVSNASSNASHAVDQLRAVAAAPARHAAFAKTARIADAANAAPDIVSALEDILAGTDFETANARVPSLVRAASEGHDRSGRPLDRARVGSTCAWAADVVSFARAAAASSSAAAAGDSRAARDAAAALTAAMTTAGFGLAELARVPAGVAVPIRDALRRCRRDPPEGWPAAACALVGRDDLAAAAADAAGDARAGAEDLRMRAVPGGYLGDGADDGEGGGSGRGGGTVGGGDDADADGGGDGADGNGAGSGGDGGFGAAARDGMAHVESYVGPLLFGRDRRLREVRALLGSATPAPISAGGGDGGGGGGDGDPEAVVAQQARLWSLAPRTAALSVGRGAFTLGTDRARPTEALRVPTLTFAGFLPAQRNATVKLDLAAASAGSDFSRWPEFHNGVAAGLALAARTKGELTRSWIVFNRPREPSHAHAGVLMALGLTGHLRALTNTDLYRYLVQEHDATTVGCLLGTAAARRGSMNPDASKMCFLHLPARHPSAFPEVELSLTVQSAALLSVGFLYQGTAHRLMAEILLDEMSREPGGEGAAQGREGYALAAGLALGLVTLGKGRAAVGLADLRVPERLRRYLGADSSESAASRGRDGGGGGAVTGREENHRAGVHGWSPEEPEPAYGSGDGDGGGLGEGGSGAGSGGVGGSGGPGAGQVMRGSVVNLDVTAPGATLALGLMFMRTNDADVAARLAVPNTRFALDHARPDFILLRVVARSLIVFDSVRPTVEWAESALPPLLRAPLREGIDRGVDFDAFYDDEHMASVLGTRGTPDGEIDREALAQAHVNALAGACVAMGLRFAGTADPVAAASLRSLALRFLRMKSRAAAGRGAIGKLVDRPTLETCVGAAATALGCVMAGTGDLETLRLLRRLRLRLDAVPGGGGAGGAAAAAANAAATGGGGPSGLTHGAHMAVGAAIGFVFLGGGTMTFANDDASVAALLIAVYPRWPLNTADQRCHLQAFRHLYALAARKRLLETVDAATRRPAYAPLELVVRVDGADADANASEKKTETRRVVAPCLLPDPSRLVSARVVGERYWPVTLELEEASGSGHGSGHGSGSSSSDAAYDALYRRRRLPVQRLAGALPYAADPTGARAGLSDALRDAAAATALRPPRTRAGVCADVGADEVGADEVGANVGDAAIPTRASDSTGTFTSDPALLGFRRLMCGGAGGGADAAQLAAFSRAALHECMTREEPGALPAYVETHADVAAFLAVAEGCAPRVVADDAARLSAALADARLLAAHASRTSGDDGVLPPSLATGYRAAVSGALDALGYAEPGGALSAYYRGETVSREMDPRGLFGWYLGFFRFPTPAEASVALARAGLGAPGSGIDPDAAAAALATGLAGTPPAAILRVARCGV